MHPAKYILPVPGDQRGMTLLEIMLALLILGTVVTMISITLSGSLNVMNATQDQGEIYHRAQVALQRISEDLASALLVEDDGVDFVGVDEQVGGQDADSLQFASTAHVVFNKADDNPGIAVISYTVQEDSENEGGLVLIRSDELLATTAKNNGGKVAGGFLLSDRLRSVNFRYVDENGEETDSWTTLDDPFSGSKSDPKLPVAVSCTLEFWLDRENDFSVEFSTSVLLPVGMINAPKKTT